MPHREFDDEHGQRWQVWETRPRSGRAVSISPTYRDGWLSFEPVRAHGATATTVTQAAGLTTTALGAIASTAGTTGSPVRLRLTPIPDDWTAAPEPQLRTLLAAATPVQSHLTKDGGA